MYDGSVIKSLYQVCLEIKLNTLLLDTFVSPLWIKESRELKPDHIVHGTIWSGFEYDLERDGHLDVSSGDGLFFAIVKFRQYYEIIVFTDGWCLEDLCVSRVVKCIYS